MKDRLNAATKPDSTTAVKRKNAKSAGLDKRWWYVVVAVLCGTLFASMVLATLVGTATRAVGGLANATLEASSGVFQAVGQSVSVGCAQVLVAGDDSQRIELLAKFSEMEVGTSAPDFLIDAVESNLTHDNEQVRSLAGKVWARIKDLERTQTNVSFVASGVLRDGEVISITTGSIQ